MAFDRCEIKGLLTYLQSHLTVLFHCSYFWGFNNVFYRCKHVTLDPCSINFLVTD